MLAEYYPRISLSPCARASRVAKSAQRFALYVPIRCPSPFPPSAMSDDAATPAQKLNIATYFIMSSPVGEVDEVVTGRATAQQQQQRREQSKRTRHHTQTHELICAIEWFALPPPPPHPSASLCRLSESDACLRCGCGVLCRCEEACV